MFQFVQKFSYWVILLFGLFACQTDPKDEPTPCFQIEIVSGNQQSGLAGNALANPLVVRVTDDQGQPQANVSITWTVSSGGGSVAIGGSTNADGLAQANWTLGSAATQTLTASLGANCSQQSVSFQAQTQALSLSNLQLKLTGIKNCNGTGNSYDASVDFATDINLSQTAYQLQITLLGQNGSQNQLNVNPSIQGTKLLFPLCLEAGSQDYVDVKAKLVVTNTESNTLTQRVESPQLELVSIQDAEFSFSGTCSGANRAKYDYVLEYEGNFDTDNFAFKVDVAFTYSDGTTGDFTATSTKLANNRLAISICASYGDLEYIDFDFRLLLHNTNNSGALTGSSVLISNWETERTFNPIQVGTPTYTLLGINSCNLNGITSSSFRVDLPYDSWVDNLDDYDAEVDVAYQFSFTGSGTFSGDAFIGATAISHNPCFAFGTFNNTYVDETFHVRIKSGNNHILSRIVTVRIFRPAGGNKGEGSGKSAQNTPLKYKILPSAELPVVEPAPVH